jgi:glucose dehydrogenase
MRHAVVHANKNGFLYILDRRNGKPILGIREKKVPQSAAAHTFPTQPWPAGQAFSDQCPNKAALSKLKAPDGKPYKIGCIYTTITDKQFTAFAPAALGGTDWPPSSYSPQTGYMYLCSKDGIATWKDIPVANEKLKKLGDFSQVIGLTPGKNNPARKVDGALVAMNLRNNHVAWKVKWPNDMCYSGVMSTAGGLTFVGRNKGYLQAYDSKTGKLLWTSPKLKAGVNAPAVTYTANAKQYIVVFAGGNGIATAFGGVKPNYGSELYAFELPS